MKNKQLKFNILEEKQLIFLKGGNTDKKKETQREDRKYVKALDGNAIP